MITGINKMELGFGNGESCRGRVRGKFDFGAKEQWPESTVRAALFETLGAGFGDGVAWRGVALFKLSGFSETVRKGKRERGAGQGRAGQGFNHL